MFDDLLSWLSNEEQDKNISVLSVDKVDRWTGDTKTPQVSVLHQPPTVHPAPKMVDKVDSFTDTPEFKDWSRRPFQPVQNSTGITAGDIFRQLPNGTIKNDEYLKVWRALENQKSN